MKIFKTKIQLRQWRKTLSNESVGFVPTMGALHKGHLSLVKASKKKCQKTVVSVFINKLQFGPHEDFNAYPRFIEQDIALLENEKIDALFCPEPEEMYPNDISFKINEDKITNELEGKSRPGFFSGVCLVVLKLFNVVQPDYVFFGEKDIQQLYIIKQMIQDLNFPIALRACPTVREKNGLAMSSRNKYLSDEDKKEACILYQALVKGKKLLEEEKEIKYIKKQLLKLLNNKNISIDYLSIANLNTFKEAINNQDLPIVIAGAVYYKKIRLIDNIIIKK